MNEISSHLSPEQVAAVRVWAAEAEEMVMGTGRHSGHDLSQAGRCVYCSCGKRVGQGRASTMLRQREGAGRERAEARPEEGAAPAGSRDH